MLRNTAIAVAAASLFAAVATPTSAISSSTDTSSRIKRTAAH
jgi:hypothetical protein